MNSKLFESILKENKEHLIKKMNKLTDEQKSMLINFFKTHANLENKVDSLVWTKPSEATWKNFSSILDTAKNSRSSKKKQINVDLSKMFDFKDNQKNVKIWYYDDRIIFVSPLNHDAAIFMDSYNCYGVGAKWCIGTEDDNKFWAQYINEDNSFVMLYDKQVKQKYMFEINKINDITVWDSEDEKIYEGKYIENAFEVCHIEEYLNKKSIITMLDKLPDLFFKIQKKLFYETKKEKITDYENYEKFLLTYIEMNRETDVSMLYDAALEIFDDDSDDENNLVFNNFKNTYKKALEIAKKIYNEKGFLPDNVEKALLRFILIIKFEIFEPSDVNEENKEYTAAKKYLKSIIKNWNN
jgi:hypothetical protein